MTALIAVEWSQGIEDAWSDVASFVPKFLGFLIIVLVGYFVAKLIAKALNAILERVGFDKAVERGGIKKALDRSQYDASDILAKVVFYALFLIVLQMAFGVFGQNPISDLLEGVIAYLPKVIAAILIIVIAAAIAAAARELIDASLGGLSYGPTLANATGIAIVVVGIFAALNQLQIAPAIVTGLFYAVLAIIVGSAVIAIGGGGITPMRARWENTWPSTTPRSPSSNRPPRAPRTASPNAPNSAPNRPAPPPTTALRDRPGASAPPTPSCPRPPAEPARGGRTAPTPPDPNHQHNTNHPPGHTNQGVPTCLISTPAPSPTSPAAPSSIPTVTRSAPSSTSTSTTTPTSPSGSPSRPGCSATR
jgi:hypothetical protein